MFNDFCKYIFIKIKETYIKGIDFITDEKGEKKAVVIDLKKHRAIWEDFYDNLVAEQRMSEPGETLDSVRKNSRPKESWLTEYSVALTRSASKELMIIDEPAVSKIFSKIEVLSQTPPPLWLLKAKRRKDSMEH